MGPNYVLAEAALANTCPQRCPTGLLRCSTTIAGLSILQHAPHNLAFFLDHVDLGNDVNFHLQRLFAGRE
jgi:hypothetical protein